MTKELHYEPSGATVRHATVMLALTTVLWGVSFPMAKDWHEAATGCPGGEVVAGYTLIALRMLLGLAVLAVLRPGLLVHTTRKEHWAGGIVGIAFVAGLVYFLEPVFGSLFSVMWGHDQVTLRLLLGGALILGGNLLVEAPRLRRPRATRG